MTAAQRKFWLKIHRRALAEVPDMNAAILRALTALQRDLKPGEIERLITQGGEAAVLAHVLSTAAVDTALQPVRTELLTATERAAQYFALALPPGVRHVGFDRLNQDTLTAIRNLTGEITRVLRDDVRESIRQYVAAGLEAGQHPRTVARGIRDVLGLAPNQELAVRNLERELLSGKYKDAARRALIDKRFNLAKLDALAPAERAARIEKIVAAYRKSFVAYHAETVSKAATLSSYKIGQQLTWQQAAARGDIDGSRLMKEWVHFDPQPDPRPEHQAMNGQAVPFDSLYSNGARFAGEDSPWNCRCLDRYYMARAGEDALSGSGVQQYAARRAPTEAIGASTHLAEPGWATATDPDEIARRAALTRAAVADVTKTLGYRGEIEVVERASETVRSRLGKDFTVMGEYNPGSKGIKLFAENIPSAAEARGVLVHEITHAQFDARIVGKRENFEWMRRNVPALEREDGVSPYSTAFWRRAERVRDFMEQREAINETLAEWSRLRAAGATPAGRPTYQALYDKLFQPGGKKK